MIIDDPAQQSRSLALTEEEQERIVQLGALCRVYEQADRVLTGDPINVNVMSDGPAPAWSDGAAIFINQRIIEDMDIETLTEVTGLNYHELAHHFYTPRRGTELIKWVLANGYMTAINILEDQRIETLLVARYPSVAPYLINTCARWLGETPEEVIGTYPLIRGRRYLPVEIREAYRDEFCYPSLIPVISEIVDQYRLLAFPRDYDQAKILIQRFQEEVLGPLNKMFPKGMTGGPNQCSSRDPMVKGRPEPGKSQERDATRAGKMELPEDPWEYDEDLNEEDSGDGDENEDTPELPAPESAGQAASLRDALLEKKKKSLPALKPGKGHQDSKGGIPNKIADLWDDAIDAVYTDKHVQQDIKSKQRVIVGGDGKYDDATKHGKYDLTDVPTETISAARKFAKELERLRDECDPSWNKGVPSGKLNVQRVINGCEIDEAFDRWDEGNDGADVEAVILVDRSGSMGNGNDKHASLACWTIKRALEAINAPVTVYAFDDQTEVAYKRSELAHKTRYKFIYGNGGTNPYGSLVAAEQLLISSRKKNKMLFIVSDGVFDNTKNDEIIERISKRGILTSVVLIMETKDLDYYSKHGVDEKRLTHGAEIFARVSSARDLIPFAKSVVMGAIKKRRG